MKIWSVVFSEGEMERGYTYNYQYRLSVRPAQSFPLELIWPLFVMKITHQPVKTIRLCFHPKEMTCYYDEDHENR